MLTGDICLDNRCVVATSASPLHGCTQLCTGRDVHLYVFVLSLGPQPQARQIFSMARCQLYQ